jgi:hypothetical protein
MSSQINVPQLDNLLQLAQKSLILKIYTIFTNESSTAQLRRIVSFETRLNDNHTHEKQSGKALAELLYNSEGNCQLVGEMANKDSARYHSHYPDVEMCANGDRVRPIINTLECPDTVLSFLASAILARLYSSRVGNASPWGPWGQDNSYSRIMNDLQLEENAIKQYYFYVRAKRQPSSGERVALPMYCLLESDGENKSGLPQGSVLLGLDEGRLDFLHCDKDAEGRVFTYMVLQPTKAPNSRCVVAGGQEGGKLFLSLHIDARDSVMINNQKRRLQVVCFGIAIENDLTNLKRGLEATGVLSQRQRPRRSSSLIIPLDDLDHIDQIDRKFSQSSYSSSARSTTDQATSAVPSLKEALSPVDELDHVSETSNDSSPQSPLTELSRTPTDYIISSPRKQRVSQPLSPGLSRGDGVTKKSAVSELVVPPKTPRTRQAKANHQNIVNDMQETKPNEGQTNVSGPAHSTRSRASQSRTDVSASTGPKYGRSDTQESLVFTTHRPKGKLYTALSKTVVGHTEDHDTSEGFGEQGHQVGTELTSVPSPLPGGTGLTLHKKSKKRDSAGCTNQRAAPRPKGQSKGVNKRRGKANPKERAETLSPTTASTGNDKHGQQPEVFVEAPQRNAAANDHECDSSPLPEMSDQLKDSIDARNFPKHTRRKAFGASALRQQDYPNGSIVEASRSLAQLETSCDLNRTLSSSAHTKSNSDKQQSSGQTVAEKLIAVLEESGILPEHFDENWDKENIENNAEDVLIPEEPHTYSSLFSSNGTQGTSSPQEAGMSLQDTTVVEPRSTVSLAGTQHSSLQTGTDRDPSKTSFRKRAGIFGRTGYEPKRARKISSLITTSSIEPQSTQSTVQFCQTRPRTQPKEDSRIAFPFHEISGNASVGPQMPGLSDANASDIISAGNEPENRYLTPVKPLHSVQQRGHNHAGISLEPNFKITIDKNGSPRRSQGKSEQFTAPQRAPSSTQTIARAIAEPSAVSSAPQVSTSRTEKQSSFNREGVSKVAVPCRIELSKMPQEQRLTDGDDGQGEDLRGSSANELLSRMAAPDSKRAFGLTSDTSHRQTLLQELHREVERTLVNTDEVSQVKGPNTHSNPTKKLSSNYIVILKPNEKQSTKF